MTQNQNNKIAFNYTHTGVLNVFLAAATVFLMIYYAIISNVVTASSYRIGLLNDEFSRLLEVNGTLTAQKLLIEDSSITLDFVKSHNMAEAGHVTHIFESGDVALQR